MLLRILSEYSGKNNYKGVFRYYVMGIGFIWAGNDNFLPKYGQTIVYYKPFQRV